MKKTTAYLTTSLGLVLGSLHAQTSTVPAFINYQGRVTDSTGAGLGATTPVNRKVIFRIYDVASGGVPLWSEEHTVTISNGEFSVLLGNGSAASYQPTTPAKTIDKIFTSPGLLRYVEIVVDNADGTLNATDVPIAPRQQITSTAYAFRALTADSIAANTDLQINGGSEYGIGYYGTGRPFNGANVNGPVIYGQGGGALGSVVGSTQNIALQWNAAGNIGIGAAVSGNKLSVGGNANFTGNVGIGGSATIGGTLAVAGALSGSEVSTSGENGYRFTSGDADGGIFSPADGTITFRANNAERVRITPAGVGIGLGGSSPGFPLNFAGGAGDKISFWGESGATVGIGTQLGLLQLHGANANDDIAFGYGSSASFSEKMRVKGNGNVGIGTTAPAALLNLFKTTGSSTPSAAVNNLQLQINSGTTSRSLHIGLLDNGRGMIQTKDNVDLNLNPAGGNVTVGSPEVSSGLYTYGPGTFIAPNTASSYLIVGTAGGGDGALYLGNPSHGLKRNYNNANDVGLYTTAGNIYLSTGGPGVTTGVVVSDNKVGIGTNTPTVPLDVAGATSITMSDEKYNSTPTGDGNVTWNAAGVTPFGAGGIEIYGESGGNNLPTGHNLRAQVSIRTYGWIATRMGFAAYSDRRIKRDIQASESVKDLAAIQKAVVTNYRMIDPADGGMLWKKGFIAQDLEKVLPLAVSQSTEFVPDIFSVATKLAYDTPSKNLTVSLGKEHGLKTGDLVRLHVDGNRFDANVIAVASANEFTVEKCETAPAAVLVYGKQVSDFRTVNYDYVFTTAVSALQQLKTEKDAEVKALHDENSDLRAQLAAMETKFVSAAAEDEARDIKLVAIEKMLAGGNVSVSPVSLKKADIAK